MIKLILLILIYAGLLLLCLAKSNLNAIIMPSFAFAAGFFLQAAYALFWITHWELELADATFFTLSGGAILFFCVSLLTQKLPKLKLCCSFGGSAAKSHIRLKRWKLILFAAFQILTLLLIVAFLFKMPAETFSDKIYYYRYANTFTENKIAMPRILRHMRYMCLASGYIWSYMLLQNIIAKRNKHIFLLVINLGLCFVNSLILGGRGEMFSLCMAVAVYFFIFTSNRKSIPFKYILIALCGILAIIFSFQLLGNVLGRNSSRDFSEYIAIYLSAEIKNLDFFIRDGKFGSRISNNQTFVNAINWLSGKILPASWNHDLDIPFRSVNGHSLGNVCTTYYSFLYDYGYWGVAVLTALMAFISQKVYMAAMRSTPNMTRGINILAVVYSYMYFTLLFSFFSNKFYETIFSVTFVYFLLYWCILKAFLEKV